MPIHKVQAPSGKIYNIEGPENIDDATLFQAANQLHQQDELKQLRKEYGPGLMGTMGQAVSRGAKQLGSTFGDVIPAMAGQALGFEDYAKAQMEEAAQTQREIAAETPPIYESYKEVETPYQALQFGAEVIGEQIPNLATALIPGAGGSILAGRAALVAAGKSLANKAAQKGLTDEARDRFVALGMRRAAPQIAGKVAKAKSTGLGAGIFLGSYAQNAPEIFQNIYHETGKLEPGVSMLFGAGSAALDSILPAQLARQLSGPLKVGIVEKVLEKSGMDKSLLRSVTAGVMKGVAGEGLTEGAQEAISIAAEKFVGGNPQVFKSKDWDRIMESSVRGAIAGGGFGAVGGGVERGRTLAERRARLSEVLGKRAQRQEEAAAKEQAKQEDFEKYKNAVQGSWAEQFDEDIAQQEQESAERDQQVQEALSAGQQPLPGIDSDIDKVYAQLDQEAQQKRAAEEAAKKQADFESYKKAVQGSWAEPFDEDIARQEQEAADIDTQAKEALKTGQQPLPGLDPELDKAYAQLDQEAKQKRADEEAAKKQEDFEKAVADAIKTKQPHQDPAVNAEAGVRIDKDMGITNGVIGQTEDDLKTFRNFVGIKSKNNPALKAVANKSINDPDVITRLEDYANSPNAPKGFGKQLEQVFNNPFRQSQAEVTEEPSGEPSTKPDVGGGKPGVPTTERRPRKKPSADTGITPKTDESGLGGAGSDVGGVETGESGVSDPLDQKRLDDEQKRIDKLPRAIRDIVKDADTQANDTLHNELITAAEAIDLDPSVMSKSNYRFTDAHDDLRFAQLLNHYAILKDIARKSGPEKGQEKDIAVNKEKLKKLREEIIRQNPQEGDKVLQFMAVHNDEVQSNLISEYAKRGKDNFKTFAKKLTTKLKAVVDEEEKTKPKQPVKTTERKTEKPFANVDYAKSVSDAELDDLITGVEKATGTSLKGKLKLTKHQGPDFTNDLKAMAKAGDLKGLLNGLSSTATNPAVKAILNKIKGLNLKTTIAVKAVKEDHAGAFDPATNTIILDPTNGLNEHTVLHELVHAAISHVLRNKNLPVTKQLNELFTQLQNQLGAAYGGQDVQEFAAELVSNPEFQALLKQLKAPKSESMFQRFMRVLAEFFGFQKGTSAYDRGLKLISDAVDISADVEPSMADMLFLGTPNLNSKGFGALGRVQNRMPRLAGDVLENTKNFLSNLPQDWRTASLGLLRLDNINTIYGDRLPSIKKLLDGLELRNGMTEKMIKKINENYKFFSNTQQANPRQFEIMQDMAYDARLEQVDPKDPKFLETSDLTAKQRVTYNKLRKVYLSLPSDVRKTYNMIRDAYTEAINEYEYMLVGDPDKGIPGLVDKSTAAKLKLAFQARKRQVAYIPFLRRGEFWVEYDENGERAASAFESVRERDRFINEVLKPKNITHRAYQNIQSTSFQRGNLPDTSFIVKVMGALDKQGVSNEAKDNVYQAYLALFPAESISKNFMKSDNMRGMERDIVRGYGETMIKWSRRLANTKYTPEIDRAIEGIKTEAENVNTLETTAVAQHIYDQRDFYHNPTYGKLTTAATTISYFSYIAGNVSSAIVNLTTLPMFTWSILGARYGFDDAALSLTDASKVAINYIFNNKVPKEYKGLFDTLNDHAQLEHTLAREVLEGRRQTTSDYIGMKASIMDWLSMPFHKTEILNRGATAIAAYNLARKGNAARGIKPMNEQDAIQYALKSVKDINTSGLSATAPKYMHHPFGRVLFTFKTFVWNSAFVVARAFHQATKGKDPVLRREAFRQLIGIYGTAIAFAGVKGLPFMGAASVLATMINALLGDEDEPYDFDVMMRSWSNELFYKGLINYALNIEVANRVGVANDLIFRDDPRSVAEHGYVLTALKQAFGPAGAFTFDVGRGADLVSQGEVYRGIEAMMPTFMKNGFKAYRFANEGVLTLKGEPVIEDISAYNVLMQLVGFSPANLTNAYETIGMLKGYEREILAKRTQLLNKYDMARKAGDYDLMHEVREDIAKFNALRIDPKARITNETLQRSQRARDAVEKQTIHGVRFSRSLRSELDALADETGD